MASRRDIRRLAFQALFQLDARAANLPIRKGGGQGTVSPEDAASVRDSMQGAEEFSDRERDDAFRLAVEAFNARKKADDAFLALAPSWPAHRQPAVDRAILRLAYYEMTARSSAVGGKVSPKAVVSEAVELAKSFGTEKSPGFVNALLDRVLKELRSPTDQPAEPGIPPADQADSGT